ncbi:NAD(P)/FAD-dependent oxidoreductase [Candidatus Dependentiae bacterium]|nr:NAD(P)/FAD-dependent oxidoreductase [Candidatus Dependentiae bacterium]
MNFYIKKIVPLIFCNFILYANDFTSKYLEKKLQATDETKSLVPLAIIGGGSAGLAAGIYGGRANMHTVVFMGTHPGGQLVETSIVENIPGVSRKTGEEIMDLTKQQAKEFGALLLDETIKKIEIETSDDDDKQIFVLTNDADEKIYALAIVIATGSSPRKLNVPGEDEYFGNGVSTCALCDCVLYKGQDVVIVGGGDDAVEKAMQVAPYAKNVTILVRSDRMRAAPKMCDKLSDYENVKIVYNKKVTEIVGDGDCVTGIRIIDILTLEEDFMPVAGVFLAVGHNPNTGLYKDLIDISDDGYIILQSRSQQTCTPGIYAAGDVADGQYRQAGTANGDGIKAALDAVKYLRSKGFTEKVAREMRPRYYKGMVR